MDSIGDRSVLWWVSAQALKHLLSRSGRMGNSVATFPLFLHLPAPKVLEHLNGRRAVARAPDAG